MVQLVWPRTRCTDEVSNALVHIDRTLVLELSEQNIGILVLLVYYRGAGVGRDTRRQLTKVRQIRR